MILCNLRDCGRIETLHPLLKELFDYVKTNDLGTVPAGRIELKGEKLFINVSDARLLTCEEQKLEIHRRYIDVHIPLTGTEIIGWKALGSLTSPSLAPFNEKEDFALYAEAADSYVEVRPGECLIAFPEDAHAPVIGNGTLRKLIAKVRIG